MLNLLKTLIIGSSARAEERLTDVFAIDLIEQKIREAEAGLGGAKQTLAALIVRERAEQQMLGALERRIGELEGRAREALAAGRDDLAGDAAVALADLENERAVRRMTLEQLGQRIVRTRGTVEKANRRIIDLKQGMIAARAADAERRTQKTLNRSIGTSNAAREAEALIARVLGGADPLAESEVLDEIDQSLDGSAVNERLAAAGFGPKSKSNAASVLARLKAAVPPQV